MVSHTITPSCFRSFSIIYAHHVHALLYSACTSAMLKVLYKDHQDTSADLTFQQTLLAMRDILKQGKFAQIPQLSSSRPMDIQTPFDIVPEKCTGTRRAVMIGYACVFRSLAVRLVSFLLNMISEFCISHESVVAVVVFMHFPSKNQLYWTTRSIVRVRFPSRLSSSQLHLVSIWLLYRFPFIVLPLTWSVYYFHSFK